MPTSFLDQFYTIDPANPPAAGSAVNFAKFTTIDQNDDGDIDRFDSDSVNGQDITNSWPGDTVTINVPGTGNVTYTGITFYLADGGRVFTPTDGAVLQDGTFVSSTFVNTQGPLPTGDLGPPCFTPGTLIATPNGDMLVDALSIDDLVNTLDNGPQPIRWIGRKSVAGTGNFAPVRIAKQTFGNKRDLLVSQQHRFLREDWRADLMFGEQQTLIAAKHLVNGDTVRLEPCDTVEYIHLMFDTHEVIFAEDTPCESFFAQGSYANEDRTVAAELASLFLDMPNSAAVTARPVLRGFEARMLA